MTADTTVELHNLLEGLEDAPVLVLAWSPARTTLSHHPSSGIGHHSIPDVRFVVIEQAAHLAYVERPGVVTRVMLNHLGPISRKGE